MASKGKEPVIEQEEAVVGDIVTVNHYGKVFHGFVIGISGLQLGIVNINDHVSFDGKPPVIYVLKTAVKNIVTDKFSWFKGIEKHMDVRWLCPEIACKLDSLEYLIRARTGRIDEKFPDHKNLLELATFNGYVHKTDAIKICKEIDLAIELVNA